MKQLIILKTAFTNKYFATRAYKQLDGGYIMVTGKKEDVTDQIEGIIEEQHEALKSENDMLKKALKDCVEATGNDLDGNNNDYNWLIREGADEVRKLSNEFNEVEAENEQLREALENIEQHQIHVCGAGVDYSATYNIAKRALEREME